MADKKLKTYDCTLSFSFSTKDDDFMNPDFHFDHIGIILDVLKGGSINLFGDLGSKHPIIISDVENVLFSCASMEQVDIAADDLLKSILHHQDLESLGGCVFAYQPLKGSRFFLGVKEKEFCYAKKEIESPQKSEKFSRRRRDKKA